MAGHPAETRAADTRADGRSDHKAETRQTLIDVALALFAANGYEATSTEEIAAAAGVSPRTFFRYFETKDRVLFFGGDAFNKAIVRELPSQRTELGELAALEATITALVPLVEPLRQRIRLYFEAVDASPVLLGQHTSATAEHHAEVAQALAARRALNAPDARCAMAAQLATIATERAYRVWVTAKRPLVEVIPESFALLRDTAGSAADPLR